MPADALRDLSTEELFRLYAPFVSRFLFRLGVRGDALDDVVQEVFLVAHRNGGYKVGPAKPTSYLGCLAMHAASAYRRREQTRRDRRSDVEVEELVSTNRGPVQILETQERLRVMQAALDHLEPELRTVLVLVEIEGESSASIASAMGIPVGTVYWRLHQARKKFQSALRAERAQVPRRARPWNDRAAEDSRTGETAASVALLLGTGWSLPGAQDLLDLAREHSPVDYSVAHGLERHLSLVTAGAKVPAWAPAAAKATASAAGLGTSLAVLAVVALAAVPALLGVTAKREARTTSAAPRVAAPVVVAQAAPVTSATTRVVDFAALLAAGTQANAAAPSSTAPPASPAPPGADAVSLAPSNRVPSRALQAQLVDPAQTAPLGAPTETAKASSAAKATEGAADDLLEARQIAVAERLLASNPGAALALVRARSARYLGEERGFVEIMALVKLGRTDEARALATRFLRTYPEGAFSARVRPIAGS